jgi:hypothetical protein
MLLCSLFEGFEDLFTAGELLFTDLSVLVLWIDLLASLFDLFVEGLVLMDLFDGLLFTDLFGLTVGVLLIDLLLLSFLLELPFVFIFLPFPLFSLMLPLFSLMLFGADLLLFDLAELSFILLISSGCDFANLSSPALLCSGWE